jgi:flagellar protein FliS
MNAAMKYGKVQAATASNERLMVMAFETALRHMRTAVTCFEDGRRGEGVLLCTKASDLVIGLQSTLDTRWAPELCQQLAAIYQFTCSRLLLAATSMDAKVCAANAKEAIRAFAPLVDGFSGAVEKVMPRLGTTG